MSDQRTFGWKSGGLPRTSLTEFWEISLTVQEPQIPNMPLVTPDAAPPAVTFTSTLLLMGCG